MPSLISWSLGEEIPQIASITTKVEADGDELMYILEHFKYLPHTDEVIQRWYGDIAKFIVGNL